MLLLTIGSALLCVTQPVTDTIRRVGVGVMGAGWKAQIRHLPTRWSFRKTIRIEETKGIYHILIIKIKNIFTKIILSWILKVRAWQSVCHEFVQEIVYSHVIFRKEQCVNLNY
jgi:hypothetical protein